MDGGTDISRMSLNVYATNMPDLGYEDRNASNISESSMSLHDTVTQSNEHSLTPVTLTDRHGSIYSEIENASHDENGISSEKTAAQKWKYMCFGSTVFLITALSISISFILILIHKMCKS